LPYLIISKEQNFLEFVFVMFEVTQIQNLSQLSSKNQINFVALEPRLF